MKDSKEIFIGDWKKRVVIYILAAQLVRWLPVSIWSIKTVPNELMGLAKEVSRWNVKSANWVPFSYL